MATGAGEQTRCLKCVGITHQVCEQNFGNIRGQIPVFANIRNNWDLTPVTNCMNHGYILHFVLTGYAWWKCH